MLNEERLGVAGGGCRPVGGGEEGGGGSEAAAAALHWLEGVRVARGAARVGDAVGARLRRHCVLGRGPLPRRHLRRVGRVHHAPDRRPTHRRSVGNDLVRNHTTPYKYIVNFFLSSHSICSFFIFQNSSQSTLLAASLFPIKGAWCV